jgi:hypothetical protein
MPIADAAGKIAAIAWHIPPIMRGRQHERIGVSIHGQFPEHSLPAAGNSLLGFENVPVRVGEFPHSAPQANSNAA